MLSANFITSIKCITSIYIFLPQILIFIRNYCNIPQHVMWFIVLAPIRTSSHCVSITETRLRLKELARPKLKKTINELVARLIILLLSVQDSVYRCMERDRMILTECGKGGGGGALPWKNKTPPPPRPCTIQTPQSQAPQSQFSKFPWTHIHTLKTYMY